MERKNLLIALPDNILRERLIEGLLSLSSFSEAWAIHVSLAAVGDIRFGDIISEEARTLDAIALVDFDSLGKADIAVLSRNRISTLFLADFDKMDAVLLGYANIPQFRFLSRIAAGKPWVLLHAAANLASIKTAFSASEKKSLRSGESFQNLLKALPDFVYVLDNNGNFTYLNEAARDFGYEPESLIGKHFSEIIHADDRPNVSREAVLIKIRSKDSFPETPPKLFDERRSGNRMTRELEVRIIHGKTGEILFGLVNAYGESVVDTTLYSLSGETGFITMGAIRDITAVRLYQKSLEKNLAEKELLLKEIHHRVRNNLQVIASLAHLREMEIPGESARKPFSELIAQIKSMAIVHEALYQTEGLSGVATRDYFERFARLMAQTYGHIGSPVTLKVEADDIFLEADKLSYIGMIASEFVSNAYRYAFPDNRPGTIVLIFTCFSDRYELKISDDGIGPSPEADENAGPGMEIAAALAKQIGASIERSRDRKSALRLVLPLA